MTLREGLTVAVDVERLKPGTQVRFPGRMRLFRWSRCARGRSGSSTSTARPGRASTCWPSRSWPASRSSRLSSELRFDGDPVQFRLGVEARRIDIAFAYEMAAVAVSNIQPLPHQLEAVYECFLREPRLRFLLADDPGRGQDDHGRACT